MDFFKLIHGDSQPVIEPKFTLRKTAWPIITTPKRPAFILTHLAAIHKAIKQGANVHGFYLLDFGGTITNGWRAGPRRFGLIGLNPETQERTVRKSAEMLGEISKANAITEEIVNKYAPEAIKDIFV